jgi:transposase
MLTVDDYGDIRRARRNGFSIKQLAREFEHSRNTIRKVLANPEPNPIPQTRIRTAPVLGPFFTIIDQILRDDESAPPKQRHTAAQVLRRLRGEHGYHGGYAQVQRYLFKHRRRE